MIQLTYDLHIHSCLSPCGDNDMTPANIIGMAALKELDAVALTDHNSCKNCAAAMKIGEQYGVLVIPGMELTTTEEVHVLCLFEKLEDALLFDEYVYAHLMPVENRPDIFGEQLIVNEKDECVGSVSKLLITATDISFSDVYELISKYNGVMIPAHIDKDSYSLISNLGFVPPDSRFGCVELKKLSNLHRLKEQNPYLMKCRIITDSDAHYLEHINEPDNTLYVDERTIKSVLNALKPI